MRQSATALALLAALALPATPATAQTPSQPPLQGSIGYEYRPATKPETIQMRERLMKREMLEELVQFLSPLKLRRRLVITTEECPGNGLNAWYMPRDARIVLCYQYLNMFASYAAEPNMLPGFTREEVFVGSVLSTALHEVGHAVFHLLDIAVFGHEEDAADQIAAFVMLQFGPSVARTTIKGAAYKWFMSATRGPPAYYDTHGTSAQRYYNYLCIAYGGQPQTFGDLASGGSLPRARVSECATEYQQIRHAFGETMMRHIDQELLRKVLAKQWLRPGDGSR
jgi:Putative metallopeptidase